MSSRNYKYFIADIIEAINRIETYTNECSFENFQKDIKTQDAVIKNLEVIGEASNKIPTVIKEKYLEIPWKEISGLRNHLIHAYFTIDFNIIWNIIQQELPKLKIEFEKIRNDIQE
ncbi:MAG: DUF86 domain-containing protein [Leptospiraceae bacterium]|nr:DUF86 domain-containing protein [Leptospiraceae bacterium]